MGIEVEKTEGVWVEEAPHLERWYQRVALLAALAAIGLAVGAICMAAIYRLM